MGGVIFIGIIIALIVGVSFASNLRDKIVAGQVAQQELEDKKDKLTNLQSEIKNLQQKYDQDMQRLKEEKQVLQEENSSLKETLDQERREYRNTITKKDELYNNFAEQSNKSIENISSLIADHLTLQYDISADYVANKKTLLPKKPVE